MASGKIQGIRNLSKKETRELSKLLWVADDAVLSLFGPARVLPDGRVLLCNPDGSGNLYPSRAVAEEVNRSCAETERLAAEQQAGVYPDPPHRLLPPIDDFLRDVEALAKSLGPRLRIPDEVLDGTPESLDAVDKALKRIPWAKRQVPDSVTPLVAYLGEVIRKGTGGYWTKSPKPRRQEAIYDPADLLAHWAAKRRVLPIAIAAADKAAAEAKARGASAEDVDLAWHRARAAAFQEVEAARPGPIRTEIRESNEPMVMGRGVLFQPFASVFHPMIEPSRRIPLRSSPGVMPSPPGPRR